MNEAELAAIYLGAVECSMLADIGLIEVADRSSDAALRADRIFPHIAGALEPLPLLIRLRHSQIEYDHRQTQRHRF